MPRLEGRARHLLINDAGLKDQADIGGGTAVADRGLIGIHLDESVVHPQAGESREDMLHGLDLGIPLHERRGALDGLHMVDEGVDDRFVGQVGAAELVAVARRGGVDGQGDIAAVVQGAAGEGGGCG